MSESILRNGQRKYALPLPRLRLFVRRLKERLRLADAGFSVLLTNNRRIHLLNRRFRQINHATDVLSFPTRSSAGDTAGDEGYLGDIVISVETARQQALVRGHSLETELRILIIHGLLHLLGYDHERDRGQMRGKERLLRRELV
jgi:probable rRNA maturation factor